MKQISYHIYISLSLPSSPLHGRRRANRSDRDSVSENANAAAHSFLNCLSLSQNGHSMRRKCWSERWSSARLTDKANVIHHAVLTFILPSHKRNGKRVSRMTNWCMNCKMLSNMYSWCLASLARGRDERPWKEGFLAQSPLSTKKE
jgi:hypothetical protein